MAVQQINSCKSDLTKFNLFEFLKKILLQTVTIFISTTFRRV